MKSMRRFTTELKVAPGSTRAYPGGIQSRLTIATDKAGHVFVATSNNDLVWNGLAEYHAAVQTYDATLAMLCESNPFHVRQFNAVAEMEMSSAITVGADGLAYIGAGTSGDSYVMAYDSSCAPRWTDPDGYPSPLWWSVFSAADDVGAIAMSPSDGALVLAGRLYSGDYTKSDGWVARFARSDLPPTPTPIPTSTPTPTPPDLPSDLHMKAVSCPQSGVRGNTITVNWTAENLGSGSSRNFWVGLYLSSDTTITTGDTRLTLAWLGDLAPRGTYSGSASVTIPTALAAGTYFCGAIADVTSAVAESDEMNNATAGNSISISNPPPPRPPPECTGTTRNASAYSSGVSQGIYTVLQTWRSAAVAQDPRKCNTTLAPLVIDVIPGAIASAFQVENDLYTQCRAKGILDGTVYELGLICPPCVLDGIDWGELSANVYCALSTKLGGLGSVPPWFMRADQPGICAANFQTICEDVYRFIATNGADALDAATATVLRQMSIDPFSAYLNAQSQMCVPFTTGTFVEVFNNSVYVDCSYQVPPAL
jgi:hypothetical protein